jgi:tRNA(Ile)-lysidine synthase TilS/MesJ
MSVEFARRFIKRGWKFIEKHKLLEENDRIFIAMSGGKDSLTTAYLLKSYVDEKNLDCELVAFHLNLNFEISKEIEEIVKKQTDEFGLKLVKVNIKDYGINLVEISEKLRRSICSVCGVVKRYLMNKVARENNATKLATGHNADDFLIFFFKNVSSGNYDLIAKFKPVLKSDNVKMVTRIRPLFEVGGEETKRFCDFMQFEYVKKPCPFFIKKIDVKRIEWEKEINRISQFEKNFKKKFMSAILKFSDCFKLEEPKNCKLCGEPTNKEICAFCRLKLFQNRISKS